VLQAAAAKQARPTCDLVPHHRCRKSRLNSAYIEYVVNDTALSYMHTEPGQLDRRRVAALVGVAPVNRDSGQMRGKLQKPDPTRASKEGGARRVHATPLGTSMQSSGQDPMAMRVNRKRCSAALV
jgi:hypothetical protein